MDFPIQSLMDEEDVQAMGVFSTRGLSCPKCQASVAEARKFRKTETSGLQVYRCKHCESIYNLIPGRSLLAHSFVPHKLLLLMKLVSVKVAFKCTILGHELGLIKPYLSIRHFGRAVQPEAAFTRC